MDFFLVSFDNGVATVECEVDNTDLANQLPDKILGMMDGREVKEVVLRGSVSEDAMPVLATAMRANDVELSVDGPFVGGFSLTECNQVTSLDTLTVGHLDLTGCNQITSLPDTWSVNGWLSS